MTEKTNEQPELYKLEDTVQALKNVVGELTSKVVLLIKNLELPSPDRKVREELLTQGRIGKIREEIFFIKEDLKDLIGDIGRIQDHIGILGDKEIKEVK